MSYSEEQIAQITDHLDQYGPSACPMCQHDQWSLHPDLVALCAQQPNGINMMRALQTVQVMCDQCGYVVSYAGDKVGVAIELALKKVR
jgi:hypothetical protein